MNKMIKWAKFYVKELGWSIIPINPKNKKPVISSWKEYQRRVPTEEEVEEWWDENPWANMAVVTGSISNLTVIDIDEYEIPGTLDYMKELYRLSHNDPTPPWEHTVVSRTTRGGYHWFFQHREDMISRRVIPAVDCKTEGGYVIIAPSVMNGKKYQWIRPPYNKDRILVPSVFPGVYESLFSVKKNSSCTEGETTPVRVVDFGQGSRDESLFHVANSLVRGGSDIANIRTVLYALGRACDPPFPEKDIEAKILSALGRQDDRMGSLAEEVREWVMNVQGVWTYELLDRDLKIVTKQERANRRVIIHRLCEEEIVEPAGGRAGTYRSIIADAEDIDFVNVEESDMYEDFEFPLGEERLFRLMPKNIVIVSGSPDSGKTAYMMSLVKANQKKFRIQYNSSEMGALEFRMRLSKFADIQLEDWTFVAKERGGDFHDIIQPDGVNIVDFLEMHDNFYEVGKHIKRIFDRLRDGVCFIALQKNPGVENPLGGHRAREKARLVINLDHDYPGHKAKITKAKNWRTHENPRGLTRHFRLYDGCQFSYTGDWEFEEEWNK